MQQVTFHRQPPTIAISLSPQIFMELHSYCIRRSFKFHSKSATLIRESPHCKAGSMSSLLPPQYSGLDQNLNADFTKVKKLS